MPGLTDSKVYCAITHRPTSDSTNQQNRQTIIIKFHSCCTLRPLRNQQNHVQRSLISLTPLPSIFYSNKHSCC